VTWGAVTGATQYTLQRSPDGTTGWTQVFRGFATTVNDAGLTSGRTYYYRVDAENGAGPSLWSPVGSGPTSGTTQPPATPTTAPTVTDQQATALTIAYDAVAGATSYLLQRSATDPAAATGLAFTATPAAEIRYTGAVDFWQFTFTWSGAPAGTTGYKVRLNNGAWTSVGTATSFVLGNSGRPPFTNPVAVDGTNTFFVRPVVGGVDGAAIAAEWTLTDVSTVATTPVLGAVPILVIRSRYSSGTTFTGLDHGTDAQDNAELAKIKAAIEEWSHGNVTVTFTMTPVLDLGAAGSAVPTLTTGLDQSEAAAVAAGYTLANYRVRVTVNSQMQQQAESQPPDRCAVPYGFSITDIGDHGTRTMAHEIGHCLGWSHSSKVPAASPVTEAMLAVVPDATSNGYEYGNTASIMGGVTNVSNGTPMLHPDGYQKRWNRWVKQLTVTGDGDYTIGSLSRTTTTLPQVMLVRDPTTAQRDYYIDFREKFGLDTNIDQTAITGEDYTSGPLVHLGNMLLDLGGPDNSTGATHHVGLIAGRTYEDPTSHVKFSLVSKTASTATVRVSGLPVTGVAATGGTTGTVTWTDVHTGPELSVTDGGLTAATNYWYQYAATNSDGQSPGWSPVLATSTLATLTAPSTPAAAPTVTSAGTDTLTVTWSTVARASSYTLQRSANGTTGWTTITPAAGQAGTSFSDTGRTAATTYYYRFSATNSAGTSGNSPVGSATTDATGATTVQPFSALAFTSSCGIDFHPNFGGTVYDYANADELISRIAATGATYVRGGIGPGTTFTKTYATALRKYGIKWCMNVVESPRGSLPTQTTTETANKVKAIAADYADLCIALEGANEINYLYTAGQDWVTPAVNHNKAIYNTARSFPALDNAVILGPALQAPTADANPAQWQQLADAGILGYQDFANIHSYPNAYTPMTKLDARLKDMRAAYGANYPAWVTEFGYTNNVGGTGNPTTDRTQGIYVPRAYLQFVLDRGLHLSYYEAMDDPDPADPTTNPPTLANRNRERHFGWWRTSNQSTSPTTWTPKPVVASVTDLLARMKDPATVTAPYTPSRVTLRVSTTSTDVKWHTLATKAQSDAGTATVFIYRNVAVNNAANTDTDVTVSTVSVTITDRVGARTFDVGADVLAVTLR
jgi:hypothetical protein